VLTLPEAFEMSHPALSISRLIEMRAVDPQAILPQLSEDVPTVMVDVETKAFCETSDSPVEVSAFQGPCCACTGEQEGWGLFGLQTANNNRATVLTERIIQVNNGMALSKVSENRLNKNTAYNSNSPLASLGTNLRTTRICGEEGPSLREKREGWGPLTRPG
jgi:hypothetical protein